MDADEAPEFTERWRIRLWAAQTDLINAYGGPKRVVENFEAVFKGCSRANVGRWHGGQDRLDMPAGVVMALEAYAGPIVSKVMLEFLGLEVAGPSPGGSLLACLSALNAELVEVSGRMMVETVRAKADGLVTPAEAQQLRALSRRVERIRAEIDDHLAAAEAREPAAGEA